MHTDEGDLPSIDDHLMMAGYWCECHLVTPETEFGRKAVASLDSDSVESAVQWIGTSVRMLIPSLALDEAEEAICWLRSGHRVAADALRRGEAISVSVAHGRTRIEWTVRRVVFLALASRLGQPLPVCVDLYSGPLPIR